LWNVENVFIMALLKNCSHDLHSNKINFEEDRGDIIQTVKWVKSHCTDELTKRQLIVAQTSSLFPQRVALDIFVEIQSE
jgi:hypothetical protein